jgi:hypothetical protein
MQKIHFVTYGDDTYFRAKKRLQTQAKSFNFESINIFGPDDLTDGFKQKYKNVLQLKRGAGYCIWKVDVITQILNKVKENDIVIYADAGCVLNDNGKDRLNEYINMLNESPYGNLGFALKHREKVWTTNRLFEYFGTNSETDLGSSYQIMATIMIYKKCKHTTDLFEEFYKLLDHDMYLITDKYNQETMNKRNDFKDTRYDQSIFSLLRKIYGCKILDDETYGNPPINKIPILASRSRT